MRPLTAKPVRISPQLMGGMELEAQVGNHAFDGGFGACHGMDHGERAVDHIVSDTPKSLFNSPRSPPNVQSAPRTDAREALECLGLYLIPRPKSSAILSTPLSAAHVFLLEQCPVQTPP